MSRHAPQASQEPRTGRLAPQPVSTGKGGEVEAHSAPRRVFSPAGETVFILPKPPVAGPAPWRIVCYFDPQATSPNQRLHWGERSRRNKSARQSAVAAWTLAGQPEASGPVRVTLTVRRARKIDPDNALAGCKAAIDSLFSGCVTPRDSDEWVEFAPVRQETGARYAGRAACVEFLIEPLGAADLAPEGEPR